MAQVLSATEPERDGVWQRGGMLGRAGYAQEREGGRQDPGRERAGQRGREGQGGREREPDEARGRGTVRKGDRKRETEKTLAGAREGVEMTRASTGATQRFQVRGRGGPVVSLAPSGVSHWVSSLGMCRSPYRPLFGHPAHPPSPSPRSIPFAPRARSSAHLGLTTLRSLGA